MRRLALLASFVLCACPPHLKATVLPSTYYSAALPSDAAKYDHEVLFDSDRWLFYVEKDDRFTEHHIHRVVRVLSDSGREVGAQKSSWHRKAQLADIAGQVIQPDGTVQPLERSQVFWTVDSSSELGRAQLAFQLPNVHTGSLVEYSYVIRWPWIEAEANRDLDQKVPVLHYEVEVQKSARLDYVLRAYHTQRNFDVTDEGAFRHIRWVSERLEPATDEDFVDVEGPRWLYRNTAVGWKGKYYPIANSWADVYQLESKRVDVDGELYEGFDLKLDVSGCADARCKVERAWQKVHQLTDTTETGRFWSMRPLKAVVASQTGTAFEQVLLFRRLLKSAGVQSDTVFVTRAVGRPFDAEFPNSLNDDVVAWVRPDEGLPDGLFVDASCEECKPGVLRDRVDGAHGVKAWAVKRVGDPELHGERVVVKGDGRSHDERQLEIKVQLNDTGDLDVTSLFTGLGAVATSTRQRERGETTASQRAAVEKELSERYPQAKVTEFLPPRCEKDKARCEAVTHYQVAQGAVAAGNQLSVPLSMLPGTFDKTFAAESRTVGIRITGDQTIDETVTLSVPKGWKVAEAPKPFSGSGGGFSTTVEVRVEPTQVVIRRQLVRARGRWPASDYADARTAVRRYAELRQQAVLLTRL